MVKSNLISLQVNQPHSIITADFFGTARSDTLFAPWVINISGQVIEAHYLYGNGKFTGMFYQHDAVNLSVTYVDGSYRFRNTGPAKMPPSGPYWTSKTVV